MVLEDEYDSVFDIEVAVSLKTTLLMSYVK